MDYNRYKIPPNFKQVSLHHQASRPYDIDSEYKDACPCCNRAKGLTTISICTSTNKFMRISQQLPLFFSYSKWIMLIIILMVAVLSGQYLFSSTVQHIMFKVEIPTYGQFNLTIGFLESNRITRFVLFIVFSFLILTARVFLKKNKYIIEETISKISTKSIILTNVPKGATIADIRNLFSDCEIQNVVFTYKVQHLNDCMERMYRLKKELFVHNQLNRKANQKKLKHLSDQITNLQNSMLSIKLNIRNYENVLDIVFVTFYNSEFKKNALKKYGCSSLSRILYKICTCCSPSVINGKHITIKDAPDPEDIDWLNLEADYILKKFHRGTCYFMCFSILIFGIVFQYQIDTTYQTSNFSVQIVKSIVVFCANYLIIMLLQYTTNNIEKHEYNTNKVISLIKKLTFFVFLNLSMSPLSIFIYNRINSSSDLNSDKDKLVFSIVLISITNVLKPFAEYFNVQRINRFIGFYRQKAKKLKCNLTQIQANQRFQPIQFPIASFYSLIISSFFLICFFLSVFQILLLIQLLSCAFLLIISKYMLAKVCKQPIGLSKKISKVSQKLLTIAIYLYWIGEKIMYYFLSNSDNKDILSYILTSDIYNIIELAFIVFVFIASSKILSTISHKVVQDKSFTQSLLVEGNLNANRMTYEEVNSIKYIEQQYERFFEMYR